MWYQSSGTSNMYLPGISFKVVLGLSSTEKILLTHQLTPSYENGIRICKMQESIKVLKHTQLVFLFLQKHRCLPTFWSHIVLYIQWIFILTNEIPRKITQKV